MGFFTVPVRGKKILAAIVVHCHAGPQAHVFHEAIAADACEIPWEPLPDVVEHRVVIPHICQPVCFRIAENQFGYGLSNAAQGVFSITQDPDDAVNAAAAVRVAEDPAQGLEGHWVGLNNAKI